MNIYDLWKFTQDEQKELLGEDIGDRHPIIVVELDEQSKRCFYNETFAPLQIRQYPYDPSEIFQIIVNSIDDMSLNITWEVKKMDIPPHQARIMLDAWLKRTNYFINLKGLEAFCSIFGKADNHYN